MRTIILDSAPAELSHFCSLCTEIPDIQIIGQFLSAAEALDCARSNPIDLAFLAPEAGGLTLAKKLRAIREDMLIAFISGYTKYAREFNKLGGDYYLVKPIHRKVLELAMERLRLLACRLR